MKASVRNLVDRALGRLGVATRLHRVARPAAPVLLAALLFGLVGVVWPLGTASTPRTDPWTAPAAAPAAAAAADLDAFLAMDRWGPPVYDAEEAARIAAADAARAREEAEAALNPKLVKLGFIGLTFTPKERDEGEHAVWLRHPAGHAILLVGGDTLPDGRTLTAVTDNSLTLTTADGRSETLLLFRRPESAADGVRD